MYHSIRRRIISFVMCGISTIQVTAPNVLTFAMDQSGNDCNEKCNYFRFQPRMTFLKSALGHNFGKNNRREFVSSCGEYWSYHEIKSTDQAITMDVCSNLYKALNYLFDQMLNKDDAYYAFAYAILTMQAFVKYYKTLEKLYNEEGWLSLKECSSEKTTSPTTLLYQVEKLFASRFNFAKREYKVEYLYHFLCKRDSDFWKEYCLMETKALAEYLIYIYFVLYKIADELDPCIYNQVLSVFKDCTHKVSPFVDKDNDFIKKCLNYCHFIALTVLDRLYKLHNLCGKFEIKKDWEDSDVAEAEKQLKEIRGYDYREGCHTEKQINRKSGTKLEGNSDVPITEDEIKSLFEKNKDMDDNGMIVELIKLLRKYMVDPLYGVCPFEKDGELFIKDDVKYVRCYVLVPYIHKLFY